MILSSKRSIQTQLVRSLQRKITIPQMTIEWVNHQVKCTVDYQKKIKSNLWLVVWSVYMNRHTTTRWWSHIVFMFIPILGEMIQIDGRAYFLDGLNLQPPRLFGVHPLDHISPTWSLVVFCTVHPVYNEAWKGSYQLRVVSPHFGGFLVPTKSSNQLELLKVQESFISSKKKSAC